MYINHYKFLLNAVVDVKLFILSYVFSFDRFSHLRQRTQLSLQSVCEQFVEIKATHMLAC